MKTSRLPLLMTWLVLAFFYLPIGVLILNSFNGSRFGTTWQGFTLALVRAPAGSAMTCGTRCATPCKWPWSPASAR